MEKQAGGAEFDAESPTYTIGHVLPQAPTEGWEQFEDRDLEMSIFRIGNMVMLEATKNKGMGNQPFLSKRSVLQSSSMLLTRSLADENEEWTPARLNQRQGKLAKMATSIWRVEQLSDLRR